MTIFDSRDKIGGVLRYGIPDFRLPDSVLDDMAYRHLELKGIQFRPNTYIGSAITMTICSGTDIRACLSVRACGSPAG